MLVHPRHSLIPVLAALFCVGFMHHKLVGQKNPDNLVNTLSTDFDGSNDFVTIGEPADMTVDLTANYRTIAAWIKSDDVDALTAVIAKAHFVPVPNIAFLLGTNSPGYFYGYYGGPNNTASANGVIAVSTWYLLAWDTYDASGTRKGRLWLNGVQQAIGFEATCQNNDASGMPVIFGATNLDGSARRFNGKIDEITMWNNTFTSSDHLALYHGGHAGNPALHPKAANLIHWWRMGDGDTYPTIVDQIGTADGTMTNMAGAGNFVADVP